MRTRPFNALYSRIRFGTVSTLKIIEMVQVSKHVDVVRYSLFIYIVKSDLFETERSG